MLYVVGTPIGNLEDLSIRQAKSIVEADIILAEDTRSTGFLVEKIKQLFTLVPSHNQRLISYYKEREFEKLPEIINLLKESKNIVLISQAGMPLISDPGSLLIKTSIDEQIPITVVPGPTAFTTALVASGFSFDSFTFLGFLPKKESLLKKLLLKINDIKNILPKTVFTAYESPERVNKTLEILNELMPDSKVVIAREMTKKFEEVVRGAPSELINRTYKGEITLVIS